MIIKMKHDDATKRILEKNHTVFKGSISSFHQEDGVSEYVERGDF